jgi:von Willebrand factor type A domain
MFSPASRHAFSTLLVVILALTVVFAQSKPAGQRPQQAPQPSATPPPEPENIETLKTDTDLVTVPLIATDRNGLYITDLRQEEFKISEDGVPQEIAFFGQVSAPFHVVLMLDTSSSTKDNLRQIQQAAYTFVQQLQPVDRVKIITFDDKINDLNEFTSDREVLRAAINSARSGEGTKVYDAFEVAMNTLRKIRGRRAIVLFSDGMDWHSDSATFEATVRHLDEEGVVIYPIRYETRATTERLAREQSEQVTPSLPTIDVIRKPPPSGTTAPTFPGGDGVPTSGTPRKTGPLGLPLPEEIMRRRREEERNRYPDPNRGPAPTGGPEDIPPDRRDKKVPRVPDSGTTTVPAPTTRSEDDSIKGMLDMAYLTADSYLKALADKSGGRLLRADTLASLPDAFGQIAAELRTQYMLGYYPLNKERDERYRKIKVETTRKNVAVRARPGYLATAARP